MLPLSLYREKRWGKVIEDTTVDWRSNNIFHHCQYILLINCVSRIPHTHYSCVYTVML